jgi:hypothetical protein
VPKVVFNQFTGNRRAAVHKFLDRNIPWPIIKVKQQYNYNHWTTWKAKGKTNNALHCLPWALNQNMTLVIQQSRPCSRPNGQYPIIDMNS